MLKARIAEAEQAAKPKAPRATKAKGEKATGDNPAVVALVEAVDTGDFGLALMHRDLTPGGLAKQLGVEPAVVAKLASGKRVPRANADPSSIAGRLAAWYVEATKTKAAK